MIENGEGIALKNLSEDLILFYLDDCIKKTDICKCDRCRTDVLAYALNKFPAHYVVTTMGDLFVRAKAMTVQAQADIITAIMLGVKTVADNPRHDASERV